MKESMNVAKTLAWKLTDKKQQAKLIKQFKTTKQNGLHIHCPEGATPKMDHLPEQQLLYVFTVI